MMITLSGGHFVRQSSRRKAWRSPRGGPKSSPPREHRATEEYIRGIFVDPRHRWGAGESTTETQSEFLPHCGIRTGRRDGRRGDRTQILQRNESRDIHMPRGALNSEGPKNQDPRPLAQTARDKDGVPGLLSFTSWAATPAAQALRGGSKQRAGRSVLRYAR
jgi:hypothetical protein